MPCSYRKHEVYGKETIIRLGAIRRKEYGNEEAKCSKSAFLLEIVHFDFKPLFHVHEWEINLEGLYL